MVGMQLEPAPRARRVRQARPAATRAGLRDRARHRHARDRGRAVRGRARRPRPRGPARRPRAPAGTPARDRSARCWAPPPAHRAWRSRRTAAGESWRRAGGAAGSASRPSVPKNSSMAFRDHCCGCDGYGAFVVACSDCWVCVRPKLTRLKRMPGSGSFRGLWPVNSSSSAVPASTTSRTSPSSIPRERADRHHRALGLGQVVARLRHDLRRGPAALRRVALGLRPAVPRA